MNNLVTLKEYVVGQRGSRNLIVSLPQVWLRQQGVKPGDKLEFLQSGDSSDLVIRKSECIEDHDTT